MLRPVTQITEKMASAVDKYTTESFTDLSAGRGVESIEGERAQLSSWVSSAAMQ